MQVRLRIPERIGHQPHWWQRLPNRWPFLIWLGACGLALALYFHGGRMSGISGVVMSNRQTLAPIEAGTLKAVYARVGDHVKKGRLLAEMDTSLLDAEMTVERLQAQRQFAQVVMQAEEALHDARIRQAEAAGEMAVLEEEVARLEPLVARHLVDAQTLARAKSRLEALRRSAELYPALIETLEKELAESKARQLALEDFLHDERGESDHTEAALSENDMGGRLGLLRLRRERYRMYADFDGEVSRVFHSPGETVLAGDPILIVVGRNVTGAEGFIPESTIADVRPGMTVFVTTTARLTESVQGRVVAITPDVMTLPGLANPIPQRTLRGRRVVVEFEEPAPFVPGESVIIQFEKPFITRWLTRLSRAAFSRRGASQP